MSGDGDMSVSGAESTEAEVSDASNTSDSPSTDESGFEQSEAEALDEEASGAGDADRESALSADQPDKTHEDHHEDHQDDTSDHDDSAEVTVHSGDTLWDYHQKDDAGLAFDDYVEDVKNRNKSSDSDEDHAYVSDEGWIMGVGKRLSLPTRAFVSDISTSIEADNVEADSVSLPDTKNADVASIESAVPDIGNSTQARVIEANDTLQSYYGEDSAGHDFLSYVQTVQELNGLGKTVSNHFAAEDIGKTIIVPITATEAAASENSVEGEKVPLSDAEVSQESAAAHESVASDDQVVADNDAALVVGATPSHSVSAEASRVVQSSAADTSVVDLTQVPADFTKTFIDSLSDIFTAISPQKEARQEQTSPIAHVEHADASADNSNVSQLETSTEEQDITGENPDQSLAISSRNIPEEEAVASVPMKEESVVAQVLSDSENVHQDVLQLIDFTGSKFNDDIPLEELARMDALGSEDLKRILTAFENGNKEPYFERLNYLNEQLEAVGADAKSLILSEVEEYAKYTGDIQSFMDGLGSGDQGYLESRFTLEVTEQDRERRARQAEEQYVKYTKIALEAAVDSNLTEFDGINLEQFRTSSGFDYDSALEAIIPDVMKDGVSQSGKEIIYYRHGHEKSRHVPIEQKTDQEAVTVSITLGKNGDYESLDAVRKAMGYPDSDVDAFNERISFLNAETDFQDGSEVVIFAGPVYVTSDAVIEEEMLLNRIDQSVNLLSLVDREAASENTMQLVYELYTGDYAEHPWDYTSYGGIFKSISHYTKRFAKTNSAAWLDKAAQNSEFGKTQKEKGYEDKKYVSHSVYRGSKLLLDNVAELIYLINHGPRDNDSTRSVILSSSRLAADAVRNLGYFANFGVASDFLDINTIRATTLYDGLVVAETFSRMADGLQAIQNNPSLAEDADWYQVNITDHGIKAMAYSVAMAAEWNMKFDYFAPKAMLSDDIFRLATVNDGAWTANKALTIMNMAATVSAGAQYASSRGLFGDDTSAYLQDDKAAQFLQEAMKFAVALAPTGLIGYSTVGATDIFLQARTESIFVVEELLRSYDLPEDLVRFYSRGGFDGLAHSIYNADIEFNKGQNRFGIRELVRPDWDENPLAAIDYYHEDMDYTVYLAALSKDIGRRAAIDINNSENTDSIDDLAIMEAIERNSINYDGEITNARWGARAWSFIKSVATLSLGPINRNSSFTHQFVPAVEQELHAITNDKTGFYALLIETEIELFDNATLYRETIEEERILSHQINEDTVSLSKQIEDLTETFDTFSIGLEDLLNEKDEYAILQSVEASYEAYAVLEKTIETGSPEDIREAYKEAKSARDLVASHLSESTHHDVREAETAYLQVMTHVLTPLIEHRQGVSTYAGSLHDNEKRLETLQTEVKDQEILVGQLAERVKSYKKLLDDESTSASYVLSPSYSSERHYPSPADYHR